MTTDNACETPMADRIAAAVELMQRGARMRLDAIPGDSSMSSSMFGPDVTAEIAKRLTAPEAKSEVAVKALDWADDEFSVQAIVPEIGLTYTLQDVHNAWFVAVSGAGISVYLDGLHETIEDAKAAAQQDFNARVHSALVDPEGGV